MTGTSGHDQAKVFGPPPICFRMKHSIALCALSLLVACGSSAPGVTDAPGSAAGNGGAAGTSGGAPSNGSAGALAQAGQPSGGAGAGAAGAAAGASAGGQSAAGAGGSAFAGESGSSGGSTSGGVGAGGAAGAGGRVGQGGGGTSSGGAANLPPLTVYIAGDSTVSQYVLDPNDPKSWAGWGQMLQPNYQAKATVKDDAVGGRTARRFIQEGYLATILKTIKAGDYLLVQFGTNDSNTTSTYVLNGVTYPYFADAETDFKTYLQQYIDGATGKQAIPVLVTPPPRNSAYCKGARSLANYGQAMLELGQADHVAVLDLGLKTHAYLTAICPKPTTAAAENFFKINADGSIDGTHFQENGARIMAGFVADAADEQMLGLAAYRVK
jgi:lysophospholipase L1-like esterase